MVHAWEYLHNITHVDHQFHKVDNTFICPSSLNEVWELNTTPYQQSIQMFAMMPIALGLIYFIISLFIIFICCCCKCFQKSSPPLPQQQHMVQQRLLADNSIHRLDSVDDHDHNNSNQLNLPQPIPLNNRNQNENNNIPIDTNNIQLKTFASVSQYLLAFISLCMIIFSVYIAYKLNSTIMDVQTNWDNSYQPYDICINYGHSIEHILTSAITQCENIKHANLPSNCSDAVTVVTQIESTIQESLDEIDSFLSDGQVISWGNSDVVDPYRNYLIYICISLLAFIAILIIISLIRMCMHKCICCNTLLSFILIFSMLFIWLISSIQFAFSVQVSDACVNPQDTILQGINMTDNTNIDYNTYEIVKYYLYCDDNYPYNPLYNYTQTAYNTLISINTTIYSILPYAAQCNISNETNILLNDYTNTLIQLNNVENALQCDDINGYLNSITSDLCESGINYWYLLYSLQILVIILLIIKSYCICSKKAQIDFDDGSNNHYNVNVQNDNIYEDNINGLSEEERKQRKQILEEEGIKSELSASPPALGVFTKGYKSMNDNSKYTDKDVKKCLKYLLQFIDNDEMLEKMGNQLEMKGYNDNGKPVNSNVVRKATAILKNYRTNHDSQFIHPLLSGLV